MNPRKLTNLAAQISAIRASADAAINIIEDMIEDEEKSDVCPHPSNCRIDASTMGRIAWRCSACGHFHEEPNKQEAPEEG